VHRHGVLADVVEVGDELGELTAGVIELVANARRSPR
jgi:hypothetical protein